MRTNAEPDDEEASAVSAPSPWTRRDADAYSDRADLDRRRPVVVVITPARRGFLDRLRDLWREYAAYANQRWNRHVSRIADRERKRP